MLDFFRLVQTAEDAALTVREPFLQNLITAELIAPDAGRDIELEGVSVEIHVECGLAECGQDAHRSARQA